MNKLLKSGIWVKTSMGVGLQIAERIFTSPDGSSNRVNYSALKPDGYTETQEMYLHLVNPDGTTKDDPIRISKLSYVVVAKKSEIPKIRIAHLSDEELAAMGYF